MDVIPGNGLNLSFFNFAEAISFYELFFSLINIFENPERFFRILKIKLPDSLQRQYIAERTSIPDILNMLTRISDVVVIYKKIGLGFPF